MSFQCWQLAGAVDLPPDVESEAPVLAAAELELAPGDPELGGPPVAVAGSRHLPDRVPGRIELAVVEVIGVLLDPGGVHHELERGAPVVVGIDAGSRSSRMGATRRGGPAAPRSGRAGSQRRGRPRRAPRRRTAPAPRCARWRRRPRRGRAAGSFPPAWRPSRPRRRACRPPWAPGRGMATATASDPGVLSDTEGTEACPWRNASKLKTVPACMGRSDRDASTVWQGRGWGSWIGTRRARQGRNGNER